MAKNTKDQTRDRLNKSSQARRARSARARKISKILGNPFATWGAITFLALALVGLRIHIFRLQYDLGESAATERRLIKEERTARVNLAEQKDPKKLLAAAKELGFIRPTRILHIPAPKNGY